MHETILTFWFGADPRVERAEWFRKDDAFDRSIVERFGATIESALRGGYREWTATPRGALARVLVLDQFTRNVFRGTPRAFAGDPQALADAQAAIDSGFDRSLAPTERWFLYMPFQHAESATAQERSVELFSRLAAETGLAGPLTWAKKHAAVVARFGRYPHRNAILGRTSTPEEIAFLQEPGSGF